MPPTNTADRLTVFLRDWLPSLQQDVEAQGRETVQSTVWLVGLSSALLTFIAAGGALLKPLAPSWAAAAVLSLAGAIATGVVQRVVYWLAEANQRLVLYGLRGFLFRSTEGTTTPLPLEEWWSRTTIVRAMKETMDLDYSWLEEMDVALDICRKSYQGQYDIWKKYDDELMSILRKAVAAYTDQPVDRVFPAPKDQDAAEADLRKKARRARRLHVAAIALYALTGLLFVTAMSIIAVALAARIVRGPA